MVLHILLGSALVFATTVVHAACTWVVLRVFRAQEEGRLRSSRGHVLLVSGVVLMLFLAYLLESGFWAATYLAVGAIEDVAEALYFSNVTFTTLGYGDVVLSERWRLLASFEAANGIMMFGWTTALIVALVTRIAAGRESSAGAPRG